MTTIKFPASPTIGQIYAVLDKKWEWNGVGWVLQVEPRATDAQLRDRTTHTGIQDTSTVDGLDDALDSLLDVPKVREVSSAYTLSLADRGMSIHIIGEGSIKIPTNATVPFPVGTTIVLVNRRGSNLSIDATGITLHKSGETTSSTSALLMPFNMATLHKVDEDEWMAGGAWA